MKRLGVLTAVLLTGIGVTSVLTAAMGEREPELMLQIGYTEEQPGKELLKALKTTMVTRSGEPIRLHNGGQQSKEGFSRPLTFGATVEGVLTKKTDHTVAVDVKLTAGQQVEFEDQKDVALVRSQEIQIQAVVKLGEKRRLNCADGHWCEIKVTEAK